MKIANDSELTKAKGRASKASTEGSGWQLFGNAIVGEKGTVTINNLVELERGSTCFMQFWVREKDGNVFVRVIETPPKVIGIPIVIP